MAVAWTDITNGQVAAGAALTTALVTALRDNPEGIAQRASGAPKIFGNAYDYQEFTSSGTWAKPSNAESGDKVIVQVVGGGGGGRRTSGADANGGGGGAGWFEKFNDIDDLNSTETVVVGAGGTAGGGGGGDSSFGTSGEYQYRFAEGGDAPRTDGVAALGGEASWGVNPTGGAGSNGGLAETPPGVGGDGANVDSSLEATSSVLGGGGGGRPGLSVGTRAAGMSVFAGNGGHGTDISGAFTDGDADGEFPGGGGGGTDSDVIGDTRGATGGAGVVRVWCIKEE